MGRPENKSNISSPASSRSFNSLKLLVPLALLFALTTYATTADDLLSNLSLLTQKYTTSTWDFPWGQGETCNAPAPNLFAYHPPRPSNDDIAKASKDLDKYLSDRSSKPDIDSISISVVTAAGPIFEGGYGILKANETDSTAEALGPPDRDSIYRLASISKMFTVLETLILRERGVLNWDDPVDQFLPEFNPPSFGWAEHLTGLDGAANEKPRITLRQLASHLSGIGRDYPPIDLGEWPITQSPERNSSEVAPPPSYDDLIQAISTFPLVNVPYSYPIYSNTGMSLLGLANVAANKRASATPDAEPQTHSALVERDIFGPLGMRSSFFRIPDDATVRRHVAVPAKNATWADLSLGEVSDAAGGQYGSAGDLATVMRTLLAATARGGVIPARVVREWLRPLHTWGSAGQEVGAPWEITTLADAKVYAKGGNLPGYHSEFALVPEHGVGIVLLVTGEYADTMTILKEAAKRIVRPIARLHEEEVKKHYAGTWVNGDDVAEVEVKKGALVLKKLVVRGIDVLALVQSEPFGTAGRAPVRKGVDPVGLWTTGRPGEFRLAFGRPELNKVHDAGCMPYWVSIDFGLNSRGAPLDLVYWKNGVLTYPSSGVSFSRKN